MKMTNRFDEVAQLKALPGRREAIIKREQDPRSPNYCILERIEIERDLLEAAPWLLEVAGCFQPGDGNLIYELISAMGTYFGGYYGPHKAAMHRLLRAAKIIEERE
jgi:hypothetical protein